MCTNKHLQGRKSEEVERAGVGSGERFRKDNVGVAFELGLEGFGHFGLST